MPESIDPYLDALRKSAYPQGYIDLIIEHVHGLMQERRFLFEEGAQPYYNPKLNMIVLPTFSGFRRFLRSPHHTVLPNLLTRFFINQINPLDPSTMNYVSYMRNMLLQEYLALSSEGLSDVMTISLATLSHLNSEDRGIIFELIGYLRKTNCIYKSSKLIERHTIIYNTANDSSNTPPENGFDPPMLPATLARMGLEIFKNQQNTESISKFFLLTSLLPPRLALYVFERTSSPVLKIFERFGLSLNVLETSARTKNWRDFEVSTLEVISFLLNSKGSLQDP